MYAYFVASHISTVNSNFNTYHTRLLLILLVKKTSTDPSPSQTVFWGVRKQKFSSVQYTTIYSFNATITELSIAYIWNYFKLWWLRKFLLLFLLVPIAQFLFLCCVFQIREKDALRLFCNVGLSTLILIERCQGFIPNI